MDSFGSDNGMSAESNSPKVFTQLECVSNSNCGSVPIVSTDGQVCEPMAECGPTLPAYQLRCMESGDETDYSLLSVLSSKANKKPYNPSDEAREDHNHKERLRRSRIKCSTEALRALVPGVSEKTDKATVLEHTVSFVFHLSTCASVNCRDYVITNPPPISAELLQLYPSLLTGEYRYYCDPSNPSATSDFEPNQTSHIIEVHESNGNQYVTTSDGQHYMVIDNTTDSAPVVDLNGQLYGQQSQPTDYQPMDTNDCATTEEAMCVSPLVTPKTEGPELAVLYSADECRQCVAQVMESLTDNKENIDPNGTQPRVKRSYRKRQPKPKLAEEVPNGANTGHKIRRQRKSKTKVV